MTTRRWAETIGLTVASALVGGVLGWFVAPAVGIVTGVVAGLNGALSGWRGIYAWRTAGGWVAWLSDSTWALVPTLLGLVAHAVAVRGGGFEPSLSDRCNRHVYRRGAHLQAGYVFTIGNVISSAGEVEQPRHRKLIVDHEDVHIWQARVFGPLYVVVYGLWSGVGALIGVIAWLRGGRREQLALVVRTWSYYDNPFEWWAYCRDDLWPPGGAIAAHTWKRRIVRPFSEQRTEAHLREPVQPKP